MSRATKQYREDHPEASYVAQARAASRSAKASARLLEATKARHFWEVMGMTPAFAATQVAAMSVSLNAMFTATTAAERSAFNTESMKQVGLSALWTVLIAFVFGVLLSLVSSIIIQGFVEGKKNSMTTIQAAMKSAFKEALVYTITCLILYVFNMIGYFIVIYAGHVTLSASSWYLFTLIAYYVIYLLVLFITMIVRHAPFKSFWRTIGYIALALLISGAAGYVAVIFPSNLIVLGYAIAALILSLIRFALALVDKYWARRREVEALNAVPSAVLPKDKK